MYRYLLTLIFTAFILLSINPTASAERILYIPHDDRPISLKQTVETAQAAGIDIILPPAELLGNRNSLGQPDELWEWLDKNIRRADAVVLSSDALIYGSLVASRKHNLNQATIDRRVANFATLKNKTRGMTTYVFASVMRSPRASEGGVEPAYYETFGPMIFEYTALLDKQETKVITRTEAKRLKELSSAIPMRYLKDWLGRREKNLSATLQLVKLAKQDTFKYLIVGRDDNALYSQTRRDCRRIDAASGTLGKSRYASVPGVDELGLLMITRAACDLKWDMPRIATIYAPGIGGATVPTYSDQTCAESIEAHLFAAGAYPVVSPERADIILAVNTDLYGRTYEAAWDMNDGTITDTHRKLTDTIESHIQKGKKVALADIKYANGADNGLMNHLSERNLIGDLYAYGGWNTADNTTGFVIAQSILSAKINDADRYRLLAIRYLDDWAYQANIRQYLQKNIISRYANVSSVNIRPILPRLIATGERKLTAFADTHLPFMQINDIDLAFPWNRTFEADLTVTFVGDNDKPARAAKAKRKKQMQK